MIRPATHNDIDDIARLGALFHAQAGWDEIPYSAEDCARSLRAYVGNPNFICIVSDDGGINGMAAAVVSPIYFNQSHLIGEELFWWVSADAPHMTGIRILTNLEQSAKEIGCRTFQMKSLSRLNGDRMAAMYERRGYRASERCFIKEL